MSEIAAAPDAPSPDARLNPATIVSVAVVAYALANLGHEALGHGGACVAFGGTLEGLNAVYCACEKTGMSDTGRRIGLMAGSGVNLLIAAIAFGGLRVRRGSPATSLDYFLWLSLSVNLLQPAGYLLFSGLMGVGDWAKVVEGLPAPGAWRIGLAIVGLAAYAGAVWVSLRELTPLFADAPDRARLAKRATVLPYLAGGLLYVAAGALNPIGIEILLISATAASFGGTSGLAWMAQLLGDPRRWPSQGRPLSLPLSIPWIVAAAAVGGVFVFVFGPTIEFSPR